MCAQLRRSRPYRFGVAFGVFQLALGVYLAARAITHRNDVLVAIAMAFAAQWSMLIGVGLLRKRPYGIVLLLIGTITGAVDIVSEWLHVPCSNLLSESAWRISFLTAMGLVVAYFLKRWREFPPNPFWQAIDSMNPDPHSDKQR